MFQIFWNMFVSNILKYVWNFEICFHRRYICFHFVNNKTPLQSFHTITYLALTSPWPISPSTWTYPTISIRRKASSLIAPPPFPPLHFINWTDNSKLIITTSDHRGRLRIKTFVVVATRPLPQSESMAGNHGASGIGQLLKAWTWNRIIEKKSMKSECAKRPQLDTKECDEECLESDDGKRCLKNFHFCQF